MEPTTPPPPTQDGTKQLPNDLRKDLVRAYRLCSELPPPVNLPPPTQPQPPSTDLRGGDQVEPPPSQPDKVTNPSSTSLPLPTMTTRSGQIPQSRQRQKVREGRLSTRKGNPTTITSHQHDHSLPPSQRPRGSSRPKRLKPVKGGVGVVGECQLPLWRPSQYPLLPPHPTGNLISLAAFEKYSQVREPELRKLQAVLERILMERRGRKRGTGKLPGKRAGVPPRKRAHRSSPEYPHSPPPLPPLPTKRPPQPTNDRSTPLPTPLSPRATPLLVTSPAISAPPHSPLPPLSFRRGLSTPSSPQLNPSRPTVSSPPVMMATTTATPPYLPATPPVTTPFQFLSQTTPPLPPDFLTAPPSLSTEKEPITGPAYSPYLPFERETSAGPDYSPSLPLESEPTTGLSYSPSLPTETVPNASPSYSTPSLPLETESTIGPSYSTNRSHSSALELNQDFVFAYKSPFELKRSQATTVSANCHPSQPPIAITLTTTTVPTPISDVAPSNSNRDQPNRHFPSSHREGLSPELAPGQVGNLNDLDTVIQAAQLNPVRPTDPSLLAPAPYSTLFANVARSYFTLKEKGPSEWNPVEANWMTNIERRIKKEVIKMKGWLKTRFLARVQYASDEVRDTIQSEVASATQQAILTYPQTYTFLKSFDTVRVSKNYALTYETNVADFGSLLEFQLPDCSEGVTLPALSEMQPSVTFPVTWCHTPIPPIREDSIVHQIIHSHEVDVVVTSGSLAALASYPLKSDQPFSLPLSFVNVVTRDPYDDTVLSERQTLIIDKALPTPTLTPKRMNEKYFQSTLKRSFLRTTANLKINGLATQASSSSTHDPQKKELKTIPDRFFATNGLSYTIWKFGDLNVLIRLKLHGCIKDPDTSEMVPASLKVKLEYLSEYGAGDDTVEELTRWWVHATVRRSRLLIAHVDPLTHSLLHLSHRRPEEIYSNQQLPQRHGRLFAYLFRELLKLPPHDYLLHHFPAASLLHLYKATLPATPTTPTSPLTPRTRSRPTSLNAFQRKLDLHQLLTAPFTVTPHVTFTDLGPTLQWGATLPTAHPVRDRIPFTFAPNPHPTERPPPPYPPHP